ncbi:MAG: AMP-binding protein [Candidatus Sericytochromatia bacterium]|nr:AMP-binding protein [Candidatus Sericytochromatia bacterium]
MTTANYVNIVSALDTIIESHPNKHAILFPESRDKNDQVNYTSYTFKELIEQSNIIAGGLEKFGIKKGCRTVLMVKPTLEFFALTFALFKAGIVPILIDPGMGIKNLKTCIAEAEPEAFIGIPKAHIARVLLGWGKNTIKKNVTVGKKFLWDGVTLEDIKSQGSKNYNNALTLERDMAAILFTSGSTGIPKGVIYNHGNFASQIESLKKIYDMQPGEIDLPTFPLFALFDPALGMTTVIPEMDFTKPAQADPKKLIYAIERFGITNMFGSPALINTLSRYGVKNNIQLPTLKRVISAGAPVPANTMERFKKMLSKDAQIFTPYGATECLPICSIGSNEILSETRYLTEKGLGVCVGSKVDSVELEIIAITDEPIKEWSELLKIPVGQIGELVVKGKAVTESYYNRPKSNELAKINDSGKIRHRMGDLGYFDAQGRVWFCGRKAHRIITEKDTLYTIPCESIFNTHPSVYRSALVGVKINNKIEPIICIELEPEMKNTNKDTLKKELLEISAKFEHTKNIKTVLFHDSFPVDIRHNAKIFREKLAVWAEKKLK